MERLSKMTYFISSTFACKIQWNKNGHVHMKEQVVWHLENHSKTNFQIISKYTYHRYPIFHIHTMLCILNKLELVSCQYVDYWWLKWHIGVFEFDVSIWSHIWFCVCTFEEILLIYMYKNRQTNKCDQLYHYKWPVCHTELRLFTCSLYSWFLCY